MTPEQKKDLSDQITHLEIQRNIAECKDFLDDEDREFISNINAEINKLKAKLK